MKSLFRNARSVVRGTALASALAVSTLMFTACDVSDAGNGGDKAEGSGEINLYTSEPEAKINEVIDAFNKENPDIQVKVFRAGTGELKTRIASEKWGARGRLGGSCGGRRRGRSCGALNEDCQACECEKNRSDSRGGRERVEY